MKNPWLRPAPAYWKWCDEIMDCSVDDRLRALRSFDAEKLLEVIKWPGTQMTVRKAAERRLRRLENEQSRHSGESRNPERPKPGFDVVAHAGKQHLVWSGAPRNSAALCGRNPPDISTGWYYRVPWMGGPVDLCVQCIRKTKDDGVTSKT